MTCSGTRPTTATKTPRREIRRCNAETRRSRQTRRQLPPAPRRIGSAANSLPSGRFPSPPKESAARRTESAGTKPLRVGPIRFAQDRTTRSSHRRRRACQFQLGRSKQESDQTSIAATSTHKAGDKTSRRLETQTTCLRKAQAGRIRPRSTARSTKATNRLAVLASGAAWKTSRAMNSVGLIEARR